MLFKWREPLIKPAVMPQCICNIVLSPNYLRSLFPPLNLKEGRSCIFSLDGECKKAMQGKPEWAWYGYCGWYRRGTYFYEGA
jgi:hypothetical protein